MLFTAKIIGAAKSSLLICNTAKLYYYELLTYIWGGRVTVDPLISGIEAQNGICCPPAIQTMSGNDLRTGEKERERERRGETYSFGG